MPNLERPASTPQLSRRRFLKYGAGALCGAALGGVYTSSGIHVVRKKLILPRWDANGFRVVQISDTHINSPKEMALAKEAVRLAVAEKPDLLVFTGDFTNRATPEALSFLPETFEALHDLRCPCYAILGNHDYWQQGFADLLRTVASTPLKLLRNQVVDVEGVSLAGIDDGLMGKHRPDTIRDKDKFSKSLLVLLHEPDFVKELPAHASLMLSGHSHGGEICLPGGIPIYTPRGARRFVSGFYPKANVPLYVSQGVGTLGLFRSYCPPDISVLTLYGS